MLDKPVDQLAESDLQSLVESRTREGLHIEYKTKIDYGEPQGRRKLGKALAAFANTSGGYLVIGMECLEEDSALPTGLPGIELVRDLDTELNALNDICRSLLEPELSGHHVTGIELANGRNALIVQVPVSWRKPHRVSGTRHFYRRTTSGQSVPLEMEEIRRHFLLSEGQSEQIRKFVTGRLLDVAASSSESPLSASREGRLLLHIIPIGAFGGGIEPLSSIDTRDLLRNIPVLAGDSSTWTCATLDGHLKTLTQEETGVIASAVTLRRTGILECVDSYFLNRTPYKIPTKTMEGRLGEMISAYLQQMSNTVVNSPFLVFMTILDARGQSLAPLHNMNVWPEENVA